jgi:hypothetical protein
MKKDNNRAGLDVDTVTLKPWQQDVFDMIDRHEECRESDQYQGIADYSVNKALGAIVALPKQSGHTFLANYIANKYPTLLVYDTMAHYQSLTARFSLNEATDTISKFEIFYALTSPSVHQPSPEFMQLRERFKNKKVVVIDNGLSVSDDIKSFIYSIAQGIVIVLGH